MNEFVSWCRHLLVSFLFHALTSLHPPSFYRNDFSTCIYSNPPGALQWNLLKKGHFGVIVMSLV